MTEQKAMAYVNLYGVLGALENLCALDAEAKAVTAGIKKPVAICFDVKDGPCRSFHFSKDGCRASEGSDGCTCKMQFASPAAFNHMIDEGKPGMPVKGVISLLSFLTGPFTKLTDRLAAVLRPDEAALADRIIVMNRGRVFAEGAPVEIFRNVEAMKSIGLSVPQVTELCWMLKKDGLSVDTDVLHAMDAADRIERLFRNE